MRRAVAISFAVFALACADGSGGIPFHTKSPTSTEPVGPELPFTPSRDRCARMLMQKQFRIITTLEAVDPGVRRLWFRRYPRREIATGNQPFAEMDTDDGAPFRFILAGQATNSWFILFETGGLLHHHTLVFFQRGAGGYRVVEAVYGNLRRNTFENCVNAVRKGKFVQTDDLSRY